MNKAPEVKEYMGEKELIELLATLLSDQNGVKYEVHKKEEKKDKTA